MTILTIVLSVCLTIIILFTLLQQVRRDEWWIRLADFPHIQITAVTFLLWIVIVFTADLSKALNIALLILGLATFVYQLIIILPYTRLVRKQVLESTSEGDQVNISILESNVYQYNRNFDKLHRCISSCNPDVFIGLETDKEWVDALTTAHPDYSYVLDVALDNTYGMILMSKIPFINKKVRYLVEEHIPSIRVELSVSDKTNVLLYVLHPAPPSPTENSTSTERDVELIKIAREVKDIDQPIIVAGDMNDVAWSHTTRLFQRMSNLLDPRIGRGFFNTFHAEYPLMRWPLDHVFHSHHFTVNEMRRVEKIDSDHFPMFISLDVSENNGRHLNSEPEDPEESDKQEAKDKMEKLENEH